LKQAASVMLSRMGACVNQNACGGTQLGCKNCRQCFQLMPHALVLVKAGYVGGAVQIKRLCSQKNESTQHKTCVLAYTDADVHGLLLSTGLAHHTKNKKVWLARTVYLNAMNGHAFRCVAVENYAQIHIAHCSGQPHQKETNLRKNIC